MAGTADKTGTCGSWRYEVILQSQHLTCTTTLHNPSIFHFHNNVKAEETRDFLSKASAKCYFLQPSADPNFQEIYHQAICNLLYTS